MKNGLLFAALFAAAGAAGWMGWQAWAGTPPAAVALARPGTPGATPAGTGTAPVAGTGAASASAEGRGTELERVPLPPVDSSAPAWLSMANARENGDNRTPPIERSPEPEQRPDAATLADHKAYADYQRDQHQRILASYAAAAAEAVPRLQSDLERGRAAGISPAELAKVEEKIRRIAQMRSDLSAKLQQR